MSVPTRLPRIPAMRPRAAGAAILAIALAGCAAAAPPSTQSPTSTEHPTNAPAVAASPSLLEVASSIANGAVLQEPVAWTATVTGVSTSDPIARVDFLVDGTVAWTEHNLPYDFNDDGNLLVPSVLPGGTHVLALEAVTAAGTSATTQSTVTTVRPAVPAALLGRTFVRQLPAYPGMQAGTWSLTFAADGVITVGDASGGGATEAYIATPTGTLTLYGPTNWIVPEAERNGFCEGDNPDGIATMTWSLSSSELALSTVGTDPCPGRQGLFTGSWALRP